VEITSPLISSFLCEVFREQKNDMFQPARLGSGSSHLVVLTRHALKSSLRSEYQSLRIFRVP